MKTLLAAAALAAVTVASAPVRAAGEDPIDLTRKNIDDVLTVLRNPKLAAASRRDQRIRRIRAIADRVFDWQAMAQSSLGVHWRQLDDAQRKRFVTLFTDLVSDEYANDMDRFHGDEKVLLKSTRQVAPGQPEREVDTILITHSREHVAINYFYRPSDDSWSVYDFSVEGISLVNHYRSTFNRFLVNHTPKELLARLERKRGAPNGFAPPKASTLPTK